MAARGRIAASDKVRVFVAAEQPLFRDGIRQTLEESAVAVLVGEASSGKDALQQVGQLAPPPEVCLIDAGLPLGGQAIGFGDPSVPGGVELGRMIKHRLPDVGLIIFASYEEEEQLFQAMKVGASAYCLRDVSPETLLDMTVRVQRGQDLMSDSVVERPY